MLTLVHHDLISYLYGPSIPGTKAGSTLITGSLLLVLGQNTAKDCLGDRFQICPRLPLSKSREVFGSLKTRQPRRDSNRKKKHLHFNVAPF
jgi:hypothetical protein